MRTQRWLGWVRVGVLACMALSSPLRAQDTTTEGKPRFKLGGEVKVHARNSGSLTVHDDFFDLPGVPPSFFPPGQTTISERTPERGSSLELSTVTLTGEMNLDPSITGRFEVHWNDLYNRNPTSSDDKLQVREAWLRFGRDFEPLDAQPQGRTLHLLVGKAPRFTKQKVRRLESYGLWSTAVGRFEEMQLELGGTQGSHLYWRAQVASGNPLFMRDPNALAGDNGTPERVPGNVHPTFESGFPILYDAKSTDVDFDGKLQVGGGIGWRSVASEERAWDVLGWYFRRTLADRVTLDGTFYSGDIKLLQGPFPTAFHAGLPIHGDEKREMGVNFEAKSGPLGTFVQVVDQEIAGLKRRGVEADLGWRVEIPGVLFGETPVFRWVQPAVRYSFIDNRFETPVIYPNPAAGWDWKKLDAGVRVGVVPGVDVTAEYSYNQMSTRTGHVHVAETLLTLRTEF